MNSNPVTAIFWSLYVVTGNKVVYSMNKEYCEKLKKEIVKSILAVRLSYDTGKKEHQCVIEEI